VTAALRPFRDGVLLTVRVTPKASRNEVTGLHIGADGGRRVAVKVTAAPDKGKANRAAIEVLADWAGLAKSAFAIVAGETDRHKTFLVTGNPARLEALIAALAKTETGD